jgi:large repetitive protein
MITPIKSRISFVPIGLLCAFAASAQPAFRSGPNYGTWPIGEVNAQLVAAGGSGSGYTFSVTSGSLPPGLAIRTDVPTYFPANATSGMLGVATTPGTYSFTLKVTDSVGSSSTQNATFIVTNLTVMDEYTLPPAFQNVAYGPPGTSSGYTYTALNAAGPVNWSVQNGSGSLPPGMNLSSAGLVSGTPTTPGVYNFTLQVNDGIHTIFRGAQINVYAIRFTNDARLPNGAQYHSYTATIGASGGAGGYTFTTPNVLPNGITLTPDGTISGILNAGPGRIPFSVTATDANNVSYTEEMSIDVIPESPVLPQIYLVQLQYNAATIGVTYSRTASVVSGGVAPFTWSATGLPPGMGIRTYQFTQAATYMSPDDAEIWGTPTQSGTFPVTLTVTDANGATATQQVSFQVSVMMMDYGQSGLPNGTIGVPYSKKMNVLGGTAPYTMSQVNAYYNPLPDGLALNASTFTVAGTPLENGSFFPVFQFNDSAGNSTQALPGFTISNGASTLLINQNFQLGTSTVGTFYNFQLSACCAPSYVWSFAGGTLPPGLNISAGGDLSGVLTTIGNYTFLIKAADATNPGNTAFRQFNLIVTPLSLSVSTLLPDGNVGTAYSQAITTTGGIGTVTWSLTPYNNLLPPGFTLSPSGTLSGTPTQPGNFGFDLTATDSAGNTLIRFFNVQIFPAGTVPPLGLPLGPNLGPFVIGGVNLQLNASGGKPPYSYSFSPSAAIVPGSRVTNPPLIPPNFPNTVGAYLAVFNTPGVYNTSVRVTDSANSTFDWPITLTVSPLDILFANGNLPKAELNTAYSFIFQGSGGSGTYSWSATNLPPGITINSSTGQLSGIATTPGTYFPQVMITDLVNSISVTQGFTLIADPFAITTAGALPAGTANVSYTQTLGAPGCGSGCTWSIVSGGLPSGLSLSSAGTLSGTPPGTTDGNFFMVQASGSNGTVQKEFSIMVLNSVQQPVSITIGTNAFTCCIAGVGAGFASALFAHGGTPPYSWSVTAGSLPPGMSLQGPGETLSSQFGPGFTYFAGKMLQTGQFNFTLTVKDSLGATSSHAYTMNVGPLWLGNNYNNLPLPGTSLVYGTHYTQQLLVYGGSGSYTSWQTISGMPPGLTLNSATGMISGTPSNTGSFNPEIQITDSAGNVLTGFINMNIASPSGVALNFGTGPNLGDYQQGFLGIINLNPSGGSGPYTIAPVGGLPAGFPLETGNSLLSNANGIYDLAFEAQTPGTYTFTLQATDTSGNIAVRTFTINIVPFTLYTSTALANGSVGVPYSQQLITFDNSSSTTWSLTPGWAYPPGLSVSAGGLFSGTPITAGSYTFQLTATDATGLPVNYNFTLQISNITINGSSNLPVAVVGVPYSFSFSAMGGVGMLSWSATGLPSGLSLSTSGVLSGTPNFTGNANVLITVTDGTISFTKRYVIFGRDTNPTELDISIGAAALADTTVGKSTSYTLPADGGLPPYTWSVASGSALPPGMNLISGASLPPNVTPGSTQLVGVPTVAGAYTFNLTATDSIGARVTRTFTLRVSPVNVFSGNLRNATAGVFYSEQLTAVGGTPPYTFSMSPVSLTQDMLPPGITLSAGGLLSGTTSNTGNYGFKLTAVDSLGNRYSTTYSFAVTNASGLEITSVNPVDTAVGIGYGSVLSTNGTSTYTWSVVAGSLPPGLSLQPGSNFGTTGTVLVGQSTTPGVYVYTLRATDNSSSGNSADHQFTMRISPMQVVAPKEHSSGYNARAAGAVGSPYGPFTFEIAGGVPPYSFTESPFTPLPQGIALSAAGVLSGTPTQGGSFSVAPIVTDSAGNTYNVPSTSWTITPAGTPPPLIASSQGFDTGMIGVPMASYLFELNRNIQYGTAPFVWTLASGSALPAGVAILRGSNGVSDYLGGIPTSAGTFGFSLTVTDATAQTVTVPFSMAVSPLAITPGLLPNGKVGVAYPSTTLVASGGTAPYAFAASVLDGMPPGMALSAGGVLSGTPAYPGFFQIGIVVTDRNNISLTKVYDVTIDNPAGQSPAIGLNSASGVPIQLSAAPGATTSVFASVTPQSSTGSLLYSMALEGFSNATFPAGASTGAMQSFFITVGATTPPGVYTGLLAVDSATATNRTASIPVVLTVAAPPPCTYSLSPNSTSVAVSGGGGSFTVNTSAACVWSATVSAPSWISITSPSPASGMGTGSITFTAAANGTGNQRTGTITVNGQQYTITQFGPNCSFAINPSTINASSAGGLATVNVVSSCPASNPGSAWTASGLGVAPVSGSGSAPVTVTIPANTTASTVVLNAAIAGQTLTVNETGVNCMVTLGASSGSYGASGGNGGVGVIIPAGCTYNTVPGPNWISVTSGASGSSSGNLQYTVNPNSTTTPRTGSISIGGQTFTVVQSALSCSITVDTSGLGSPYAAVGGSGSIGITANAASCGWTASSSAPWATVGTPSGSGSGSVGITVASNANSSTPRSTTLTVGGQSINVTQSGTTCMYSLQSATGSAPAGGGSGSVGVIAPAGCMWNASSNAPSWLTITSSGNSGTSNVSFVAAPNTGASPLTGTLTIAGLTYTVTEAGAGCSYTLGTSSTNVSSTGLAAGTGSFTLSTATNGCSPSALSYASWISGVSTAFSGTSGTVTFGVTPNVGGATRVGTIAVGNSVYTVTQTGAACSFSLNSTGQAINALGFVVAPAGAPESVSGSPSAQGCPAPQAATNQPSTVILGPLSGPDNNIYMLPYSVTGYKPLDLLPRYMQIVFGGQLFTVKQYPW